eukprot:476936_1
MCAQTEPLRGICELTVNLSSFFRAFPGRESNINPSSAQISLSAGRGNSSMQVSSGHRYTRKLMRCPGRKVHVCDSGGTFTEIRVSLAPVNRFSLLDSSSSPACTSPVRFGIKKRRAQQTRMKK